MPQNMKAKEFEREEDATAALDFGAARRPAPEQRRVNLDFPTWMIDVLDKQAARLGVTRQSVIKTWVADRLERRRERHDLRGRSPGRKLPERVSAPTFLGQDGAVTPDIEDAAAHALRTQTLGDQRVRQI